MKKRKICALVVSCAMLVSLLPTTIFAEGDDEEATTDTVEITEAEPEEEASDSADVVIGGGGSVSLVTEDEEAESGEDAGEAEPEEDAEEEPEDEEDIVYRAESGSVRVEVTAPADALPEDAKLSVERYAKDSANYRDAAEAIDLDEGSDMAALDISFLVDGEEVEPSEPVKVSIDVSDILPEDADASTLEVQHLKEGRGGQTKAEVVANESGATGGTIDEANATAEFEVGSFSTFTVSWTITSGPQSGSSYTVNVTAYLDGTELDITNGLTFSSENDELDFETLLSDLGYGTGDYTFSYAIGTIGDVTYGSEENPIVAIEITMGTTGGPGTSTYFHIVYMDGTYVDVATSSELSINAYYTTPSLTVEIVAVDEDEAEDWQLKAVVTHAAERSTLSYEWWITDTDGNASTLARVSNTDNTGQAFIVWDDNVEDNDEVVVHVKVTETDANGDTKTAEASYTLEYGDETVDLIMTYGPNQTALPAGVTVTLTNEATGQEYTFTTYDDGWVHDAEIVPGIYIISATYTVDGNTYQCSEEVSLHDAGNYSINLNYYNPDILTSVPDKDDWEHIDIKLSIGTSGSASAEGVTLNITSATIYTSTGEVRATTTSVTGNDNEFQLHWSTGDGNTHSTSFSSTDYIVINYTLTENGVTTEYSITIGPDTVYAAGTTYPVDGQRAYKLYNYLYGTSYESDAQLIAAGIGDIDISGMSLYLVAAILCDSSEVTGAGQLDVSSAQAGLDFALSINTINELATSWQFEVEKTYYNASMLADNFEFVLYDATADGDTWTQGGENMTLTNSQAGISQEGYSQDTMESLAIAYSDEDIQNGATYYYILSETPNVTSSSGATITFDETVYGIKVELGKEGEGDDATATVTVTYYILTGSDGTYTAQEYTGDKIDINSETGEPTFKFENTYQEYVTISGTKEWDDNNNAAGKRPASITINLLKNGNAALDDEGNPITVTVTGEENSWDWSFINLPVWDGITENVYSIEEEITVDGYDVTIEKDEETGEYKITNSYIVLNATAEIQAAKSYIGSDGKAIDSDNWPEDGFEFTLSAISGVDAEGNTISDTDVPMPVDSKVTVTDANAVSFGSITYEAEGTYYYQITETLTGVDYIADDSDYHYAKVVVTADANTGDLTAIVSYLTSEEQVTDITASDLDWDDTTTAVNFTNIYSAEGSVGLTATKEYTGADLTAGQFSFTITETGGSYNETVTNDANGGITFSGINYTLDDVGTHTYVIAETAGTAGGVTYDSKTITVIVTVADNGNGTLSTTVTAGGSEITAGSDGPYDVGSFSNSYEATGSVTLTATKTITGMSSTVKTFNFTLYNSNADFTYNIGDTRSTVSTTGTLTEDVAQTVTFPAITYNEAGTYYFVIIESSTGTEGDGWTYDSTEYHVTVLMEDDGEGNLNPTVTYTYVDENGETQTAKSADFTNTYKAAETSVQFAGTKFISNSNGTDEVFTFELYETENDFDTTGVTAEQVQTSGDISSDGQVYNFSEITYKEVGTHYYVIKEQTFDKEGWKSSDTIYYITVEVTDNLAGQLVATVSYVTEIGGSSTTVTGSEDVYGGFDFTNTYADSGKVSLTAVKSLSGRATSDTTFTFALYDSDENFTEGSLIDTQSTSGTIESSQQVTFKDIEYEYDSSNTYPMEYYYIIKETTTDGSGWTCDTGEYHVTVTVTDDGHGNMTTSPVYVYCANDTETSADNATFTNTYTATGTLNLSGMKTFEGGKITDGQFTYTVMEGETQVATGTAAADGTITFTDIDYTYSDVGEHTYTITEDSGDDTSVQYDDTVYIVVVTVTDNETGELTVSYTVDGEESGSIEYTNYQKGSLTISKAFTGLTDEQIAGLTDFTITVTGSDGETVASLTLEDADEGSAYTWTVSDLPADTYTVTETGYTLNGYEVIAKSGDVEVTDGSDVSVDDALAWGGEDMVEFTNDYTEVGTITITKYVIAEDDIQEAHADTEYTVVITAKEDADFQWVTVTSSSGREIESTIKDKTITFTITEDETVTISGLPAGDYTIEEQGSDAMTSEHCIPSYRVNGHDTEEAPAVTVASGSDNIVEVEIDNEYPIATYIMVQKDYNKDEYPDGGFTFTIEALSCDLEAEDTSLSASDMPMPKDSDGNPITSITIKDEGRSSGIGYFGNIEYEHLGTYYYKITETAGSNDNITYDSSVHYIKVVVGSASGTHIETTDEYEAKADEETKDYKDLDYTEAGIVTAEFTNIYYEELSIEKEVSGNAGDTSEYEFKITLTNSDGTPFEGTVTVDITDTTANKIAQFFSGIIKTFADDDTLTFEDGKATVMIAAGEKVTIMVPSGVTCTVTEVGSDADSVNVSVNGVYQAQSSTTEATAEVGTVADSTQVIFVNSYRAYFPIDEEIVTDEDDIFDRDAWVKRESVNEYNAIEIEMTTNLPVITAYDLENGEFTMDFHNVLDHELVLDEDTTDFSVYIRETEISTAYYKVTFDDDTGDDCNFHVDVDLTALYNDGIVTEDMLDGNTEITIFFFADLEGTDLNGSYTSTIWYEIYDGDEQLYESNVSVVEVYTYEIEITKYDTESGDYLAGAEFGIYYDEACTDEPVSRNGEDYTVVSDEDGKAIFYGLAAGTYYVKELAAPEGYELSDEILTFVLVEEDDDDPDEEHIYTATFANTPKPEDPEKGVDTDGDEDFEDDGVSVNVGDELTYQVKYYNHHAEEATVTITDVLDEGLDFVSASDGGEYDEDSRTITWTIENAAAKTWGSVTFVATVNETGLTESEVENTASVSINNDEAVDTNTVRNPVSEEPEPEPDKPQNPEKAVDVDGDGEFNDNGVKVDVGTEVTYQIKYYNHNEDPVTVVITDTLDYALDFVSASDGGVYDEDSRTITWTIDNAAAQEWGSVTFTATVNDIALVEEEIENTASVKVGNDAAKDTNMVANPTPASSEAGVPGSGTPKTGDDNHPLAWTLLLLASVLAMGAAYAMKKQGRRKIRNRK